MSRPVGDIHRHCTLICRFLGLSDETTWLTIRGLQRIELLSFVVVIKYSFYSANISYILEHKH
jgi:hypothetical protein